MCILCVVQRWSRRIATMLPWLVIPLIALWALSQLLPPGYRFEVTSPRLACVVVLLFTLFWYEILMPQLSSWRARRSALLREKRRFEAMEIQKLRKTATRRCRNCLTPYKDQNPGGGKFMCSYCGHISRRPVLDLPGVLGCRSIDGIANSGIIGELVGKSGKTLNDKVWLEKPGWGSGNGWMCGQSLSSDWLENGNWVGGSFPGKSYYWGKNGGAFGAMMSSSDNWCFAEKSYCGVVCFACKLLTSFFWSIRWVCRKIFRVGSMREDASSDAEHRGMSEKGENGINFHESKGEKARRKAEEKKQARLEREMLEEEERQQREEVARLVEERRRLRDEKLEAEKERGKGLALERDRENKREKETERRRQEKKREKEKGSNADKSNSDGEELERKSVRESERKHEFDKKSETERCDNQKNGTNHASESARSTENFRTHSSDFGHGIKGAMNDVSKGSGSRYFDRMKGSFLSSSRALNGANITPFFGKGVHTSAASVMKASKSASSGDYVQASAGDGPAVSSSPVSKNITTSAWDGMARTKAWGEGISVGSVVLSRKSNASKSSSGEIHSTEQKTEKSTVSGDDKNTETSFQLPVGSELKQGSPTATPKKSWHQLFTRSPAVPLPTNSNLEFQLNHTLQAVQSAHLPDQASPTYSINGQIHFGLSSHFTNSTLMSSTTVPVSAAESVFSPVGTPIHDLLPEEIELSDGPYVPDPISLLGPVSESLDNFPLDLGTGLLPNTGLGKPCVLKNVSATTEVNRPSPIESPISRAVPQRVADGCQHPCNGEVWDLPSHLGSTNAHEQGTWQMWGTPPLGQDGLGLVGGPISWLLPLGNNKSNREDIVHPPKQRTMVSQFAVENQTLPCNHSPKSSHVSNNQNGGTFSTLDPGSNENDLWLQKTIFQPLSGDGDGHFAPHNHREDVLPGRSEVNYDSLNRSVANPFELSAANCWTKGDWAMQGAGEGTGNAAPPRSHLGGLFSTPDVQSLWSFK